MSEITQEMVQAAKQAYHERMLYPHRGDEYADTDPAWVAAIEAALAKMEESK
jgi:hypothetical protein